MMDRRGYHPLKKVFLLFVLFVLFAQIGTAQSYRYIGKEDGLSSQRVNRILQDSLGYVWFLTPEGPNRYDGKEIRHYQLFDKGEPLNAQVNMNWLYATDDGVLWGISRRGRIFRHKPGYAYFEVVYTSPLPDKGTASPVVTCSYMDRNDCIWLCGKSRIGLFDVRSGKMSQLSHTISGTVTSIAQLDDTHYFIGTDTGLYKAELDGRRTSLSCEPACDRELPVSELFFFEEVNKLFVGTYKQGVWIRDLSSPGEWHADATLNDVNIKRILPYAGKDVLIATEGRGIYRMDADTCRACPYIVVDYMTPYGLTDNNINDVYVESEDRIWIACYYSGVTIRDNRYSGYRWYQHSIGNPQSVVNSQVHEVMEDSDGDLWFGTSNGISLYSQKTGRWHSFLSIFDREQEDKNHVFLALCEISPGIILAGGYTSGLYQIDKRTLKVEYISSSRFFRLSQTTDQYTYDILMDSEGKIWSGGYNLKCFDFGNGESRLYPGLNSVTSILEKDSASMWIGTVSGLYLLDKESGDYRVIDMPVESMYICALYQTEEGLLYIGTDGSGLVIHDPREGSFAQYRTDNCALISNNVHSVLPKPDGNILLATDNGIAHFSPYTMSFTNWTRDQGLMSVVFNVDAGALCSNGRFILGSNDGIVSFPSDMRIPQSVFSPMRLSDLMISYQAVYPGDKGSPLKEDINDTEELRLAYKQNTFSLRASSINYDNPSNILYSWNLEGFTREWTAPAASGVIRFTNLPPGEYTLHIRSVSNEEKYKVYELRSLRIVISPPVWASSWAVAVYVVLLVLIAGTVYRVIELRKQEKMAEEKTRFFISTAHDIRTPLTLIKAPLEEVEHKEMVNEEGKKHLDMALRNVDVLLRLVTNLINFERVESYSSGLRIAEYELDAYMTGVCDTFRSYADVKHIRLRYESGFSSLNVWFDKEKMDSILKNILSNAVKYTPENGSIDVRASESGNEWSLEVRDTGIGIPDKEQKGLFRAYFRGSNAINMKVTGSGIGLMLVKRLVRLHGGSISIKSAVGEGTCVRIVFRKGNKHFRKARIVDRMVEQDKGHVEEFAAVPSVAGAQGDEQARRLLIVEDNDELRAYLVNTFRQDYRVESCRNGKEALDIVREFAPDLVLSDIMMPEMSGDKLCAAIKENIETSHIPVLLLTALSDEKNILEGLRVGADDYIAKPFSVSILKASVERLIANRALLRKKYGSPDFEHEKWPKGCKDSLDWKFMSAVRENIEKNMSDPDFTVDTLCALHNMSRSSFYNKLKSLTGSSPADYVRTIRLQVAARLLKEGDASITEVAEQTGFCDAKYFREVFRKHYGVSPSEYRKG